jgi:acyl carrier protein
MPPTPEDVLAVIRNHVAAMIELPVGSVELDTSADLLAVDGFEVGGIPVDSLMLVDLITAIEDEFDLSIQSLLDEAAELTLDLVIAYICSEGAAIRG